MNIFYLDENIETCAEYHIDAHCTKMILECAQLLCTALWVDKLIGFVPRALTSEELKYIKTIMLEQPADINDRSFISYKACHHNHPSSIWVRSSVDHYYYLHNLSNELQREAWYRNYNTHKSIHVINRLPDPVNLQNMGWSAPTQAMPDELKSSDILADYRLFYMLDKAAISSWKNRSKPPWWDESIAIYHKRYTDMTVAEKQKTGWLVV